MDTGLVIAIVVAALIVLALVVLIGRKSRARRHERLRTEAGEHREEARIGAARADREQAEAEERAARARAELAQADEQATRAGRERRTAEERHRHAAKLDPDADKDDPGELRTRANGGAGYEERTGERSRGR
jgi:flagellar biosynthesis/type III secretory pathway M-ring protein FliF/YscJ